MTKAWLDSLKGLVRCRPIVVLRFTSAEWLRLRESRRGLSEFSFTYPHSLVERVKTPAVCVLQLDSATDRELRIGIVRSRSAVATLDSRVKLTHTTELQHRNLTEILAALGEGRFATDLRNRIAADVSVMVLGPTLSERVVDVLAAEEANEAALHYVLAQLSVPTNYNGTIALQEDAVRSALKAFEIEPGDASLVDVAPDKETAIRRIWVSEDSVIEHDARSFPGFTLMRSDVTGRAMFEKRDERIEIITANKRPLEQVFGIDLILVNLVHSNIAMLQYKMLERVDAPGGSVDWIYRPDDQLENEIDRMRIFSKDLGPVTDYRLNPEMFYLKFVKRDASIHSSAIITPLAHFDFLRSDANFRGEHGGFIVTYERLGGRYLREIPFLDLVRSGYIGARTATADQIKPLIDAVLRNERGVVAAIREFRTGSTKVRAFR